MEGEPMSNTIPRRILCSGWESHLGRQATQSRLKHPYPSLTITPTLFQLYVQDKCRVKKKGDDPIWQKASEEGGSIEVVM